MDSSNQLDLGAPVNDSTVNLAILIISVILLAIPIFLAIRSAIRYWRPMAPETSLPSRSFSHKKIIINAIWQVLLLIPIVYGFIILFNNYSSFGAGITDRCGGLVRPFVIFWNLFLVAILYIQIDFVWLAKKEHKVAMAVFDIVLFFYVIIWYYGTVMFSVSCV
jgi:hypothetical protein